MNDNIQSQNVTLHLPKELLQNARVLAARRNTSLSALMREFLQSLVEEEAGYRQAQDFCLSEMNKGYYIGAKPASTAREDLHGRQ